MKTRAATKVRGAAKIMGAVLLCAFTAHVAKADTWHFRDVLRPHGHARSMKAKMADAHKCGAVGHAFSDDFLPTMQQCMLQYGWALDHIIPDPKPRYARGHGRDDDEEELNKRNWDASNDAERQRDEESRSNDAAQQQQEQLNNDAAIRDLNNQ